MHCDVLDGSLQIVEPKRSMECGIQTFLKMAAIGAQTMAADAHVASATA